MNEVLKAKLVDVGVRALKTFVQAFLAYLAVGVYTVQDANTAKALFVGALAAGFSALWNLTVPKK